MRHISKIVYLKICSSELQLYTATCTAVAVRSERMRLKKNCCHCLKRNKCCEIFYFLQIRRIHEEHPPTENTSILVGGRLFGELFPLRAFGDVRYKWSAELQKVVLGRLNDYVPRGLHTPPYLTALPEVSHFSFSSWFAQLRLSSTSHVIPAVKHCKNIL